MNLIQGETTDKVLRAFFDVYNELGYGCLENIYQRALAHRLRSLGAEVQMEAGIDVMFDDVVMGQYRADLIVDQLVLIEVKTARRIVHDHESQLLHYLKSTRIEDGILLNFGERPQFKRLVFSNEAKDSRG